MHTLPIAKPRPLRCARNDGRLAPWPSDAAFDALAP